MNYDVVLPSSVPARVTMTFASPQLNVPPTSAVAVAEGDGVYRVSGLLTPMVGTWQAQVMVHRANQPDRTVQFDLPVKTNPVVAAAPPRRLLTRRSGHPGSKSW